jgi:hypothetical protein
MTNKENNLEIDKIEEEKLSKDLSIHPGYKSTTNTQIFQTTIPDSVSIELKDSQVP